MRAGVRRLSAALVVLGLLMVPVSDVAATSAVGFKRVHVNPPGGDSKNLENEWVSFVNTGTVDYDLTGWTVTSYRRSGESLGTYHFPTMFRLGPGRYVRVHTGVGTNTGTDLYWGRGWPAWPNRRGIAVLRSGSAAVVGTCSWVQNTDEYVWC